MVGHPQSVRAVIARLGVFLFAACGGVDSVSVSRAELIGAQSGPVSVLLSLDEQRAVGRLMFGADTLCTGAMISARHVVTAAHCFNAEVGAGRVDFIPGGVVGDDRLPVIQVQKHPSLDVALVTLGAEVSEVTPLVLNTDAPDDAWVGQPIELAGSGFGTAPSLGVGWGLFSVVSIQATQLTMDGDAAHNACRGDSGGPWFKRFAVAPVTRIVAVVSAGEASCDGANWGPRMDLAAAWIHEQLALQQPALSERCDGSSRARCSGDLSFSCVDGWWREVDCGASAQTCGWMNDGFTCLPRACGATDSRGACTRGVASWCGPGGVETLDCGARGLGCGLSADGARCLECEACHGTCVELETDSRNCGACDRHCPSDATCSAGDCVFAPSTEPTRLPTGCSTTDSTWLLVLAYLARGRTKGGRWAELIKPQPQ